MAKNKKRKVQPQKQQMSPQQFMKEKVRNLPIEVCYMNPEIWEIGEGNVIIVRRHPNDKYTIGCFLIDVFCLGVKDVIYRVRIDEEEYKGLIEHLKSGGLKAVSYDEAHNVVYGAASFAEEAGIMPHKDFHIGKNILEEDTDDVPLIEYTYGKEGKYFLVANSRLELSKYLPTLKKNLSEREFDYIIMDDDDEEEEDYEEIDLKNNPMFKRYGPDTIYTYEHPEYLTALSVKNEELIPIFYDPKNAYGLTNEDIDHILSIPADSLRHDLEQIILHRTGETCDEITDEMWKAEYNASITHALFFLGEVGNEESLDVVLEVLCQSEDYRDFHFGDSADEVIVPTLYKLGRNHLDKLMKFAKKKGLYTYNHATVFDAVTLIGLLHPERRNEIIEWYREMLQFATEKLPETQYFDSTLASLMVCDIMDLGAKELIPEIEELFATNLVDLGCCGNLNEVRRTLLSPIFFSRADDYELDIYRRYEKHLKQWGNK